MVGKANEQKVEEKGLQPKQYYSVIGVEKILTKGNKEIRLVKIKNPNDQEWNGDWSDDSEKWDSIHEKEKIRIGYSKNSSDGKFFISLEDFVENYSCIVTSFYKDFYQYIGIECKGIPQKKFRQEKDLVQSDRKQQGGQQQDVVSIPEKHVDYELQDYFYKFTLSNKSAVYIILHQLKVQGKEEQQDVMKKLDSSDIQSSVYLKQYPSQDKLFEQSVSISESQVEDRRDSSKQFNHEVQIGLFSYNSKKDIFLVKGKNTQFVQSERYLEKDREKQMLNPGLYYIWIRSDWACGSVDFTLGVYSSEIIQIQEEPRQNKNIKFIKDNIENIPVDKWEYLKIDEKKK